MSGLPCDQIGCPFCFMGFCDTTWDIYQECHRIFGVNVTVEDVETMPAWGDDDD